jgi:hypothetical protein
VEVLGELGFGDEEIARLIQSGAVGACLKLSESETPVH